MTRVRMFAARAIKDSMRPKLLMAFVLPYFGVTVLLGLALSESVPDDLGSAPLLTQEQVLLELYSQLAFVWLLAFPMVFVAVLVATNVASHFQRGTYRVLLSKPLERWEPLLGAYLGITFVGALSAISGLLVGAVVLVVTTDASSQAIGGSVGAVFPGAVIYGVAVVLFVASIGLLAAVVTGTKLSSALLTVLVPVTFFAFIVVRLLPSSDLYESLYLYVPDVNYHFGNVYVVVNDAFGAELTPSVREAFSRVSGVYDTVDAWSDPLLGGVGSATPLAGYVPPVTSVFVGAVLTVGALVGAFLYFARIDIS